MLYIGFQIFRRNAIFTRMRFALGLHYFGLGNQDRKQKI